MPLSPVPPTDTRPFFRPVTAQLVDLLHVISDDAWTKTAVGTWQVRDVVAHLADVSLRRVSFHRDRHAPPPPPFPIQSERDFVRFINHINADWITASRRLSPHQLMAHYATAAGELSDFIETVPFDAPALFGVSWAGEMASEGWFDIGREFTEQWHHQAQIREAVGAPPLHDPAWLNALLLIALRGLPHAYRAHDAADGTTLGIHITGPAGGHWALERSDGVWRLLAGESPSPAALVTMQDDAAWRLLFNGLSEPAARAGSNMEGDASLAAPLFVARSVIV